MAIKVSLRKKEISKGRLSLYLDFYPAIPHKETGEPTRREFLGLYIPKKPKTEKEKRESKETWQIAEGIRAKRANILNKPEIYTEFERDQQERTARGEEDFVAYFDKLVAKKKNSNHDNWVSCGNYLHEFTGGSLKFKDLNERFCEDFKEFLLNAKSRRSKKTNLKRNSAVSYFGKFRSALEEAYSDGYLYQDLRRKVKSIPPEESNREYLTKEELERLSKTPCNNPLLKNAAMFSALTGLRHSDIRKLVWSEVQESPSRGTYLKFRQKKTSGMEELPISSLAVKYMGERGSNNELVFPGLTGSAYENKFLAHWLGLAGIEKNITFHCFRHTYAVMLLEKGIDIYTVSKMLGHRSLKTTQVYAKIVDSKKKEAADAIGLDIDLGEVES